MQFVFKCHIFTIYGMTNFIKTLLRSTYISIYVPATFLKAVLVSFCVCETQFLYIFMPQHAQSQVLMLFATTDLIASCIVYTHDHI